MKRHHARLIWVLSGLAAILSGVASPAAAQEKAAKKDEAGKFFANGEVPRIEIEMEESSMDRLKKQQWTFGAQSERVQVQVKIRDGSAVYTNVALQLKGAAGSFRAITDKPAFTLNFDKFAKGQEFHGMDKLSLNNSVQDPTYVHELISREIFLKAGVPVPRAGHARVSLNGRDLGLYGLVEGWNRRFLKRHFENTKGNLYDGGFIKDVGDTLATNAGENPSDQSDRVALAEAAKEPDLKKRMERLEGVLDMERFLSFLAVDVLLWNWDGYAMNKNNWRLFQDKSRGKFVFMPHGLDQMLWKPDGTILPPMQGLVAKAVLDVPELRRRYFQKLKELRTTAFDVPAITNRVQQVADRIRPVLSNVDPKEAEVMTTGAADFCAALVRRGDSLDRQLASPVEPATFDASGSVSLAGWTSKIDFGKPTLTAASSADGRKVLRVGASDGSSIGSWRTSIWLEQGSYAIEGSIQLSGHVPDAGDPRSGAGLRLKSNRPEGYVTGATDWKPLKREFDVRDGLAWVEFVCEYRGAGGEASFDLGSLRIRKMAAK